MALHHLKVFYWPAALTPLFIRRVRYSVPAYFAHEPAAEFTYRDVYVFGIRVSRIQEP